MRYQHQLQLPLNKTVDATPEQVKEWEETDFFRKGDFDPLLLFVVIPTIVQVVVVGLMFGVFALNQYLF